MEKSAQVRNFMKEQNIKTPADLQIWFTNTISHYLESKKKHMMGWNEITGVKIHDYTDLRMQPPEHRLQKEPSYIFGEETLL